MTTAQASLTGTAFNARKAVALALPVAVPVAMAGAFTAFSETTKAQHLVA